MKIEEIEVINLRFEIPPDQRTTYAGGQLTGRLNSLVRVTTSDGKAAKPLATFFLPSAGVALGSGSNSGSGRENSH